MLTVSFRLSFSKLLTRSVVIGTALPLPFAYSPSLPYLSELGDSIGFDSIPLSDANDDFDVVADLANSDTFCMGDNCSVRRIFISRD